MEQLTPKEWMKDQLRHAPSFAISTALLVLFLLISAFVDLSTGAVKTDAPNVQVGIAKEESLPPIQPIKSIPPTPPPPPKPDDVVVPSMDPGEGGGTGGGQGTGIGTGIGAGDGPGDSPIDLEGADSSITGVLIDEPVGTTPRVSAVIGVGKSGVPVGAYGGRNKWRKGGGGGKGGRQNMTAILAALNWLKKVQETDGHWDPQAAKCGGGGNEKNGVTGLALLAFLGFGCTYDDIEYGPVVKRAVTYLISQQGTDGSFGERMYTQGICTLALAEAAGLMPKEKDIRAAAQLGLNYIIARQPTTGVIGGFGYGGGGQDMSVTGYQFQAFKAAEASQLELPQEAKDRADKFLDLSINNDGSCSYQVGNKSDTGSESMTAANLTARLFRHRSAGAADCVQQYEWLSKRNFEGMMKTDRYYTIYYLTLASFNMGGEMWKKWNGDPTKDDPNGFSAVLRARQTKTGDFAGSWPTGDYTGAGSLVYSTALCTLSLEVYHRYEPTDANGKPTTPATP